MAPLLITDLGLISYSDAYALQQRLAAARKANAIEDVLLLCEHPPVITLGRNGKRENLSPPKMFYAKKMSNFTKPTAVETSPTTAPVRLSAILFLIFRASSETSTGMSAPSKKS